MLDYKCLKIVLLVDPDRLLYLKKLVQVLKKVENHWSNCYKWTLLAHVFGLLKTNVVNRHVDFSFIKQSYKVCHFLKLIRYVTLIKSKVPGLY